MPADDQPLAAGSGDAGLDAGELAQTFFDLWIEPALKERGLPLGLDGIQKAAVFIDPGKPARVLLNDEATLVVEIGAARAVEKGEEVTLGDVNELRSIRPHTIDEDSAWVCVARIGPHLIVGFDFTYNRSRARRLLTLAREYLDTARWAAKNGHLHAAIENLHGAAELGIMAQMLTLNWPENVAVGDRHGERRRFFTEWVRNTNAPQEDHDTLWLLVSKRSIARYGEGPLRMRADTVRNVVKRVESMLERFAARVG